MISRTFFRCLVLLGFLLVMVSSCEKFSGSQTIPAYLSIDSVYLVTNTAQGSNSQHITDAWVTVDNDFLGAFELPAKFPVLKTGKHIVKIYPGIKKNGIAATRISYEYYTPVERTLNFASDSVTRMGNIKTTYLSTTKFTWLEDFENEQVPFTLDTTTGSTAAIVRTMAGSRYTFEGMHSGMVVLDSVHDYFECITHNEFPIPSAAVFLEMNFKLSSSLTVGVFTYGTSTLYQTPVITLSPTNGLWKKIYIDLSNTLNAYAGMTSYRVYLGTLKAAGVKHDTILFDNFKLVTR